MSLLSLGAINKNTGEYVYPKIANKKDEYICPECNRDLIFVKGEVRVHHFRHKVDCINPCHHYSNPTESQIHKDAKILLKILLERKFPISFIRNCCECNRYEEFEIPEITEISTIVLEHRFEYNGSTKQADVVYINDGEILSIFEICNTHKTCSENRPEPWFEIDAKTLIKIANAISLTSLQIPCIRCEKCDSCNKEKYKNIDPNKWFPGFDVVSGIPRIPTLDFAIMCEFYIDEILYNYEKIYNDKEIEKNIFKKCYYEKYKKAIISIKINGTHKCNWGGWGGGRNLVDDCEKSTMIKFMKYYKLANPINIIKVNIRKMY